MRFALILFIVLFASLSFAQTAIDEVVNADKQLNELILKNDALLAAAFYLEDFLLVTGSGAEKNKKNVIAEIGSPELKMSINETQKVKVRVYESTAVLTGLLHQKGSYKGKEFDVKLLVTDTWIKTPSGWKILSGHASKAPESAP